MEDNTVLVEQRPGYRVITLNRPHRLNACARIGLSRTTVPTCPTKAAKELSMEITLFWSSLGYRVITLNRPHRSMLFRGACA